MKTTILSEDFILSNMEIETNSIQFNLGNVNDPILKLCQNGDIFYKGNLIENDVEVVNALREFLNQTSNKTVRLQEELITLLESQIIDLTMMSKIELGDDVIEEIQRLRKLINSGT